MKKFLMIAVMAMSALSMSAQDSKFAAGINADFIAANGSYTTAGFGLKLQYNFTEAFRTELGYTYYLNKNENGIWAINLNFAYLFKVSEKFKVGPMAGLGMNSTHMSSDLKDLLQVTADPYEVKNTMALGFQVGVATEYQVSDHFKLGLDAMYKHAKKDGKINENPQWVKYGMDCKGFLLSATAAYCF